MNKIINPGDTATITIEICSTKRIVLTHEDEMKIQNLVRLYLKGKMKDEK